MNIEHAAKYLGISVSTLRRWEEEGKISPERTEGGHRRYNLEELSNLKRGVLLKKTEIEMVSLDEVEKLAAGRHIFVHGQNKAEQVAFAKKYVSNRFEKGHIGLVLGEFEDWRSVIESNSKPQHLLFGYYQGIEFNPLLIPRGVIKEAWIGALTTVLHKCEQVDQETEMAFGSMLRSYFMWEDKRDTFEDLLLFSLEFFLKNNIPYSVCSPIINFIKDMKEEEKDATQDYFEKSLSDLISPLQSTIVMTNKVDMSLLEECYVSLVIDYFASYHMLHKNNDNKFILLCNDGFIRKEVEVSAALRHAWERGRTMRQSIIFLTTRSDFIPFPALCESPVDLLFKDIRMVASVECLLEHDGRVSELRRNLQCGEAILLGYFSGRNKKAYLYQ